jgi:hypothetical protein
MATRRRFLTHTAAIASAATFPGLLWGEPQSGRTQSELHVFPKSRPPARRLCAMHSSDTNWSARLALCCLQGIVNRSQPRLYLVHDDYDARWLNWLRERGDVDEVQWLEVHEVFERFLPEVRRGFIIDPKVPASTNVATMLAGLQGGVAVTPQMAYEFELPMGPAVMSDSWEDGMDLRVMNWKKDIDAYRWFFTKFGDQLSRQAISFLHPLDLAARDYLVEFKIPMLWISGPQDATYQPSASSDDEIEYAR